ncbi:hypothetical protein VitviT2T_008622 [Vitis vinifera]|uniref:SET domain-containing protein n=1 Tax=Vitis vinifera TaxID=29760 RepID=A0ABY9C360_VITVI|nr:hypothetical protein VitviT2T_008622 [Vitis vinifera]
MERGPSKLCDLKKFVEGVLVSDHLIKHIDSDRWLTIKNAASLLVPVNFPLLVLDTVTQLVSPPEAPGNPLAEAGDTTESNKLLEEETPAATLLQSMSCNNDNSIASEPLEGLQIDERVRALLKSFAFIPGRELETLGEVLQASFEHAQWEKLGAEGLSWHRLRIGGQPDQRIDRFFRYPEITSKEALDSRLSTFSDKDYAFDFGDFSDWYYLDGAGHEQWPSSFSELQSLVDQDSIQKHIVVDAIHKANYASRICHLCRPNREAKVTAVEGQYQIGIYTIRQIQCGEEIILDYNSVTESKEELVFVYRESDEEEYNQFDEEFPQDKNLASTDCEEIIEEVAERIEKDLILLAATTVEDKLRNGVLECINKLAQAGRKLWVLTGDKTETAVNIEFAYSLLRRGMK